MTKEERIERAERTISVLMRLLVSAILPLWGLAMLAVGIGWRSGWWIGCGVVVGGIGLGMLVGSPIAEPFLRH
ncbi:MAG: hypothetical protein WA005_01445 [Candidatus Binataceae bacterium]